MVSILVTVLTVAIAVIMIRKTVWLTSILIIVAFAPFPKGVFGQFDVLGFSFYPFELCLYWAAFSALLFARPSPTTDRISLLWLTATVGVILISVLANREVGPLFSDARGIVDAGIAIFLCGRVMRLESRGVCIRVIKYVLWLSAFAAVLTSLGVASIGDVEVATLTTTTGLTDIDAATRVRLQATSLALVTFSSVLALTITGKLSLRNSFVWLLPSFIVIFLSFSRNHILGIAAAILFVVLVSKVRWSRLLGVALIMVFVTIIVIFLGTLFPKVSNLSGDSWASRQVDSFNSRVLEGLSADTLETDYSILYRVSENAHGWKAFQTSPIWGSGYGYAYKPSEGAATSFGANGGRYYAHNFYLWLLIKCGIIGLLSFGAIVYISIIDRIRHASTLRLGFAAATVTMLAVSFFSPQLLSSRTAILLGGVVAGSLALKRRNVVGSSTAEPGATLELPANTRPKGVFRQSEPPH